MKLLRLLRARLLHTSCRRWQEPRVNQVGIQYLSLDLHKKVFPTTSPTDYLHPQNPALLDLAKTHLRHSGLLGKKTQIAEPINIENLPDLVGKKSLDEHFTRIGNHYSEPYLSMANLLLDPATVLPQKPKEWLFESGWTRYAPGEEPCAVEYPLEDELVFDVEVLYKLAPYSVLATAASPKAWYGWVSPVLTQHHEGYTDFEHLIPFNLHKSPKLMVGYNVSYDRARVLEEYCVKQSKAFYLDAMALHVALSGLCSRQRPTYNMHTKHKQAVEDAELEGSESDAFFDPDGFSAQDVAQELADDPWLNKAAPNSLANVAEFHCNIKMSKDLRDTFSSKDINDVINDFQNLMHYCAEDVDVTHKVAQHIFPKFKEKNPHPISFAALRPLGSQFLPTTKNWENYIENAERVYNENREQVTSILRERVLELVRYIDEKDESLKPDYENDPWLKQMNWEIKLPRLKKDGTPFSKQAFLTGYPEWYRDLFKTVTDDNGEKLKEINLTVRSRITPLLLRLKWEGYPLIWTDSAGWCFKVPLKDEVADEMLEKNYIKAKLSEEDFEMLLPELRDDGNSYELFKVPHFDGPKKRCVLVMTKSYVRYFDNGVLTSEYDYAKEILNLNATASYWMGNRNRILDQFVVYADPKGEKNKFFKTKKESASHKEMGIIIPKLCTMGTVTRRATESTWLTASNSKANRIGSELKATIRAPEGYAFVGADVDSEELWIASLIGDSMFKIHGGTALGWMTLEGDKNEKTDLHSKTADILGILRNDAKVFNYGRIYGAGVKFATQLLKQCNATLSDDEAASKARELYEQTKGKVGSSRVSNRRLYHGGTESVMFNALESIAHQENPKTPVLGASITSALTLENLNKNNYLTSRVNWTIQSSGVDYLHLLIMSMEYLIDKFKIDARLMITVHDELRYLVKDEEKLTCALLLQISNLWTRAMFCEQLGIKELPQSCAFFSEVDIDFILRKEVGMECITPSHPNPIAPGESYNIVKLQEALKASKTTGSKPDDLQSLRKFKFEARQPVIETLDDGLDALLKIAKLKLQNSIDKQEWRSNYAAFSRKLKDPAKDNSKPYTPGQKTTVRRTPISRASKATTASADERVATEDKPVRRAKRVVVTEEFDLGLDGDELLQQEIAQLEAEIAPKRASKQRTSTFKPHSEKDIEISSVISKAVRGSLSIPVNDLASTKARLKSSVSTTEKTVTKSVTANVKSSTTKSKLASLSRDKEASLSPTKLKKTTPAVKKVTKLVTTSVAKKAATTSSKKPATKSAASEKAKTTKKTLTSASAVKKVSTNKPPKATAKDISPANLKELTQRSDLLPSTSTTKATSLALGPATPKKIVRYIKPWNHTNYAGIPSKFASPSILASQKIHYGSFRINRPQAKSEANGLSTSTTKFDMRTAYTKLDPKLHYSTSTAADKPKGRMQFAFKTQQRKFHYALQGRDDNFERRPQPCRSQTEYRVGRGKRRDQ